MIIIFTYIEVHEALTVTKEEPRDSGTPTLNYDFLTQTRNIETSSKVELWADFEVSCKNP